MEDRSEDVSNALTEVRSILTRAETAMDNLVRDSYRGNYSTPVYGYVAGSWRHTGEYRQPTGREPDPDTEAMYYALERVVRDLSRWRRAGKRKRR